MNAAPSIARNRYAAGLILTTSLIVFGASSGAWAAAVVVLDGDNGTLAPFPHGVQGTWQQDAGRDMGPALVIDGRGAQNRFSLFETPHLLPTPDHYRAEVWMKAEGAGYQIDCVLLDGKGQERGRHKIIARTRSQEPGSDPDKAGWIYGACDITMKEPIEGLACNIDVSLDDALITLDDLRVFPSESILTNGDFQFLDPPANDEKQNHTPRGWRRMIVPDTATPQSEGSFAVEDQDGEHGLIVRKGEGAFLLSATPVLIPEEDVPGSFVARVHLKQYDLPAPGIVVRQYGARGQIKQDYSLEPAGILAGETLITTACFPCMADADHLLLMLTFPPQSGTWRIRSVELIPLAERKPNVHIYTDQVGYDAGGPVRFVVASTFFPADGIGRFALKNQQQTAYQGSLIPIGRVEGEHGSDWGSYYFAGIVNEIDPGTYTLEAGIADTQAKDVSVHVGPRLHLHETADLAYRFYSIQRCGCEVPGWHGPCHMDDAKLPDGRHVDVTGGYHNAGDMHKHMGDNTPVSVYAMMCAYESDPAFFDTMDRDGNHQADILDEAVWGADWMRKMVDPATGHIWMNVTNDIDYYGIPEHDTDGIPGNRDDRVINTNDPSDLGAYTIAAWAVLGRRLNAPVYLDAARKLWAVYEERILAAYEPRQVFAAIELWRSTGEARYLSMAERIAGKLLELQNTNAGERGSLALAGKRGSLALAGWFARTPGGPPEMKIVDEGVIPAALARFALEVPTSPLRGRIRESLRAYFAWSFRLADNPFGLLRNYTGGAPFYFKARDDWFGGSNSAYLSAAWAANLTASVFQDEPELATRLGSPPRTKSTGSLA